MFRTMVPLCVLASVSACTLAVLGSWRLEGRVRPSTPTLREPFLFPLLYVSTVLYSSYRNSIRTCPLLDRLLLLQRRRAGDIAGDAQHVAVVLGRHADGVAMARLCDVALLRQEFVVLRNKR